MFKNRIELMNAGGLYGKARPENFPDVNDYRNPVIAEGMKNLKYVNMFNRVIDRVQTILRENGNEPATFEVDKITVFEVTVIEVREDSLPMEDETIPVTIPVTVPVSDQVKELVKVLNGEMSRKKLMDIMGLKNKAHFKTNYLQKALESGVIELTQPDSPNSPTQKYRLTEKGKLLPNKYRNK